MFQSGFQQGFQGVSAEAPATRHLSGPRFGAARVVGPARTMVTRKPKVHRDDPDELWLLGLR